MALDSAKNFSKCTVSTGYDASATTVVLSASEGAKLPTVPFNAVWYNSTDYTDPTDDPNKEIIRVTNIATDTLTVTRAQESTSAATHNTGGKSYKMIAGLTAKVINTDIPAMNVASATVAFGCTLDTDGTLAANSDTKIASQKAVKTYADTSISTAKADLTKYSNLYAPEGFLINGKIVPSVASNNLTVAIKGVDGNDPSATNPVYCRIGGTIRTITAALSVTKNAATNWCNAGSAELATKEIDYFVYLGYNATDGVTLGFSRIPYAAQYSVFSVTTTNEKYCAISTITNAASTDYYENIGRFAATLSAGAGYTWTVPTFTAINLIQRPIYETRWLDYVPTLTWSAGLTPTSLSNAISRYRIRNKEITTSVHRFYGTLGTTITNINITAPFTITGASYTFYCGVISLAFSPVATICQLDNDSRYFLACVSATADRFGINITHEI